MAARSQDLAVEKTQADGALCAHVHTHTAPGGPSILMWSGPAEWITPTLISRDSQWHALSACVCMCVQASIMRVCVHVPVWVVLLLNICPVSQQRISRFDLSISLNTLRQLVSTLRPTVTEGEGRCHSVWRTHKQSHTRTHVHTYQITMHSTLQNSRERKEEFKKKYQNNLICFNPLATLSRS